MLLWGVRDSGVVELEETKVLLTSVVLAAMIAWFMALSGGEIAN